MSKTPDAGASAVIFALLLTVLIGFVGLGVDGAALYAKKQELQNGADAGALAAAQEWVESDSTTAAQAEGTDKATKNVRHDSSPLKDVDVTLEKPAGEAWTVEVVATGTQPHWFMPVLGEQFAESDVSARAVVQIGSPTSGIVMLPITISLCEFQPDPGVSPVLDQELDLWLPNNSGNSKDDFEGCPSAPQAEYPAGGFSWLEQTGPCETFVDFLSPVQGDPGVNWGDCSVADFKKAVDMDEPILIPLFTEVVGGNGNNAKYVISRFAAFNVTGVSFQTGGPGLDYGEPCDPGPTSAKNCITGVFEDLVDIGDLGDWDLGAPQEGVTIIKLSE